MLTAFMVAAMLALGGSPAPSAAPAATAVPAPTWEPTPAGTPDPTKLPPAGIVTTTTSLADVIALYHKSLGNPTAKILTSRESDAVTAGGETGVWSEVQSGDDYADTVQLGPSISHHGQLHGIDWRQNENGITRTVSGVHEENDVSAAVVESALSGHIPASVSLLGAVTAPVDAYVIQVKPEGGRLEWLFVERTSGRLVRTEEAEVGKRVTVTYDDFRTDDGVTVPWHQHYSDGFANNESDYRITALAYNKPVAASELAIPASRSAATFPVGVSDVKLPVRIEDGVIIVRLVINGRGLDFQLDSGSDAIVLDADVARQMGLHTYGESTAVVAGQFNVTTAVVPEIQIGALTLHDMHIQCLPFGFDWDPGTKIVGLLGYDFLASVIAKVDYYNGTVDALDPATFGAPSGQVVELPLKLDDSVPIVTATVGDSGDGSFIVDTGSPNVVLFDAFAAKHAADLTPWSYTYKHKTYFPLISAEGVGGWLELRPVLPSAIHFAHVGFQQFIVFDVYRSEAAFQGEDYDGLIGYEFLQYFDLYFDYRSGKLDVVANKLLSAAPTPAPSPSPSPSP